MKPTTLTSLAFLAIAQMLSGAMAQNPTETGGSTPRPSHPAVFNQVVSQGCYKSQGNLTDFDVIDENSGNKVQASLGGCRDVCIPKKYLVLALHGDKCYCGNTYPELDELAKDAECNKPCYYGGFEPCGNWKTQGKGMDRWSVYNTGIDTDVDNYVPDKADTTSSSPAASKTSSGDDPAKTGESPEDSSRPTSSNQAGSDDGGEEKKGTNVAGIAAGVVVGVVAIAALIGGVYFYMRRKRNAEIEEEHRRNAAVNAFISGAKPPGSSGNVSMSDSRLEPGLAHRRLSDGSIADNQDYSRKILRVTNA